MDDENYTLHRLPDGRLMFLQGNENTEVQAISCFPWIHPDKFISLRDNKGQERLFITDLSHLPTEIRITLEEELQKRNFVPHIITIYKLEEKKGLFAWEVDTNAGLRSFFTNKQEQLRTTTTVSLIIKDINNDLYQIQNLQTLDYNSTKLLWIYLD